MPTSRIVKNETVAFLGEFIGTFLFLFFGFAGAQTVNHAAAQNTTPEAKSRPNLDNLLFISTIFGISLMINVWIFFRISGGMFNPVVTMALYLVGAFPILRAVVVVGAQIVGGLAAAGVVKYLIPGAREVNFAVSLSTGTSVLRGLFLEMFFTAELVFTILMLAAEKSKTTFIAPVGIGFALFIGHLCGVFFTGAGLNPTRSFASAAVSGKFPHYHWIYWVGPAMGGMVAVVIYKIFKLLRYEDVNGDQDQSAFESKSLKTLVGKSAKRATLLFDGTTKRASQMLGKTTRTAAMLYERNGNKRQRRNEQFFTEDDEYELRSAPYSSLHIPRSSYDYPKYSPDHHYNNHHNQPFRSRFPVIPISEHTEHTEHSYSSDSMKKSPIVNIYSPNSDSTTILDFPFPSLPPPPRHPRRPSVAPFPSRGYDGRYEIPIGITQAGGGKI